jgi:hypothetical protein
LFLHHPKCLFLSSTIWPKKRFFFFVCFCFFLVKKTIGTLGKPKVRHMSKVVQNTCFHLFPYRKKHLFDEGMY